MRGRETDSRRILVSSDGVSRCWRIRVGGRSGIGDGLERLPATAERLVQLHAVEQQLRVGVVGSDAYGQLHALRVEERQEIDLAAVVQRLRTTECRVGRRSSAIERLRALPFIGQRHERVLDVFQCARDRVLVAQDGFALSALGDVVDRLGALKIGIANSAATLVKRAGPRATPLRSMLSRPNTAPRRSRGNHSAIACCRRALAASSCALAASRSGLRCNSSAG